MTLALMVAGRQSGTFGTFEVQDGNVSKNRIAILNFFGNTTALVPMNARAQFTTPEEHAAFDATLMGLSQVGVGIQYVESISGFMDPKARLKEWLAGKLDPKTVGLDLTPEELAVPAAFESAKAKFVEAFTTPIPPRMFDERPVDRPLRIIMRGDKPYQLKNEAEYTVGINAAQFLWENKLKKAWANEPANGSTSMALTRSSIRTSDYTRDVSIYRNRITIGCQTIQRNQIEDVAKRLGWPMD